MHFARLANTLLKDEESARDNHVVACNFAKLYLPILKIFSLSDSAVNLKPRSHYMTGTINSSLISTCIVIAVDLLI